MSYARYTFSLAAFLCSVTGYGNGKCRHASPLDVASDTVCSRLGTGVQAVRENSGGGQDAVSKQLGRGMQEQDSRIPRLLSLILAAVGTPDLLLVRAFPYSRTPQSDQGYGCGGGEAGHGSKERPTFTRPPCLPHISPPNSGLNRIILADPY